MILFFLLFVSLAHAEEFQDPGPIRVERDSVQLKSVSLLINVRAEDGSSDGIGDTRGLRALMTREEIQKNLDPRNLDTKTLKHRLATTTDLVRYKIKDNCSGQWMIREEDQEKSPRTSMYCSVDGKLQGSAYQFRQGKTIKMEFGDDRVRSVEEFKSEDGSGEPLNTFKFGEPYRGYVPVEQSTTQCKKLDVNSIRFVEEMGQMMVVISTPQKPDEKHPFKEILDSIKEEDRIMARAAEIEADLEKNGKNERLMRESKRLIAKRQTLLHKRLGRALESVQDGYVDSMKELQWRKAKTANSSCGGDHQWKEVESNAFNKIITRGCFKTVKVNKPLTKDSKKAKTSDESAKERVVLDGPATENVFDDSKKEIQRTAQFWKDDVLIEEKRYDAGDAVPFLHTTLAKANYKGFNLYNIENNLCRTPRVTDIKFLRNEQNEFVMEQTITDPVTGKIETKTEMVDKILPKAPPVKQDNSPSVPLPPHKPERGST